MRRALERERERERGDEMAGRKGEEGEEERMRRQIVCWESEREQEEDGKERER